MQKNKYQLILGSASPRRKELLQYTFLPFQIHTSEIEEVSKFTEVDKFVCDIATQKASAVLNEVVSLYDNPLVLGADTIVALEGNILGKPDSELHARQMLQQLSGKVHQVLTGVCLAAKSKQITFFVQTQVQFDHITEDLLNHYLTTGESLDKAGSYGIQAYSLGFIGDIKGSYSNVVGLPVNTVLSKIKEFVGAQNDDVGQWRSYFD